MGYACGAVGAVVIVVARRQAASQWLVVGAGLMCISFVAFLVSYALFLLRRIK